MMLKAISSVALLVVLCALAAFGATGRLFSASPVIITLQVVAVAVAVWARRSFPSGSFRVVAIPGGETVIRRGPYKLIRHPMYFAALLLVGTGSLVHLAWWTVAVAALTMGVVVVRVIVEERLLRERYADYGDYAVTTKALIPFVV